MRNSLYIMLLSVVVVLVAFAVLTGQRLHSQMAEGPMPDPEEGSAWVKESECELISGMEGAAEDITMLPRLADGRLVALTGTDLRMQLWHLGQFGAETPSGGVYAVDVEARTAVGLTLEHFPHSVAFHPHGIFFLPNGEGGASEVLGLLFVVNHAYKYGGERMEVLEVLDVSEGGEAPLRLLYKESVTSLHYSNLLNGVSNDVVAVEEGSFYVTQYMPNADSREGRPVKSLGRIWNELSFLLGAIYEMQHTVVWHCEYSPVTLTEKEEKRRREAHAEEEEEGGEVISEPHCSEAIRIVGANGMSVNLKTGVFYIVDLFQRKVLLATETEGVGSLKLTGEEVDLKYACDNVEVDQESGRVFCGSIGSLGRHVAMTEAAVQAGDGVVAQEDREASCCMGGAQEIGADGRSSVSLMLETTAWLCHGISCATLAAPHGKEHILLGSWASPGIAICPVPQ